jgi:uncharacterized protein
VDELIERLRSRLDREPDLLVAYLFGSRARGSAGPRSDVDVAVLLRGNGDFFQRRLDLIGAVSEVVGSDRADVITLNDAPVSLAYRVVRDGQVILSRDERSRIEHKVRTIDRYLDMEPMRKTLQEGTKHRIQEGRFGRS